MIRKARLLFCIALLCLQCLSVSLVFAETVEDTPTSDSGSTISSTVEDPLKATISSGSPQTTESSVEEEKPLAYEDQLLLEQEQLDSTVPAVLMEEKQLDEEIVFRGKVTAGSEIKGEIRSTTKLDLLILQRAKDDAEWENYHDFIVEADGVNLSTTEYVIDFTETLTEFGNYRYRLIADYTIESFKGEEQTEASIKKGSLELGAVEVIEEPEFVEGNDEPIVEEDEIEPEEVLEENISTIDSSEGHQSSDSTEVIAPAPIEFSSSNIPSIATTSQLPKLEDNYRHAFQRGMGIMPMASVNVTPSVSNQVITGDTGSSGISYTSWMTLNLPVVESAQYTSRTKVKMTLRLSWSCPAGMYSSQPTGAQVLANNDTQAYNYYGGMAGANGVNWRSHGQFQISGNLTKAKLNIVNGTEGTLENLTNTRTGSSIYSGGMHRGVVNNTTRFYFTNLPVGKELKFETTYNPYATNRNPWGRVQTTYTFSPANIADLTAISTPTFTQIVNNENIGNPTQVYMDRGTYTGDVLDSVGGTFDLKTTGNYWQHRNNIAHTNTRNGTYAVSNTNTTREVMSGLAAGQEYTARVGLRDVFNVWKYSGERVFRTPNTVNIPGHTANNNPTTANNATSSFLGTYNVGAKPAHPVVNASNVRAQISTNNSTWTNVTISGVSINTSTKQVGYTISGLAPNTTYYTRYGVRNTSNAWSPWSGSRQFATNGVALSISTPTVNQGGATTSSIYMNGGSYTGNVSTAYANNGVVRIDDGNGMLNKTTHLGHTNTLNGNYDPFVIGGLSAGSTYQLQVGLRNAGATHIYSASRVFHTPNIANKPNLPTLNTPSSTNDATAAFTATYQAGVTPAHPTGANVRVYVSENGGPYEAATLAATPVVTTGSKQVSFTIKDLKAKTNYKIKYSVLNASTVWSNEAESDVFTTRGIALAIDAPTFDQDTATDSSITMNQGDYAGDIFQTSGEGRIEVTGNDGTDTDVLVNDLDHTLTTDGTYESKSVTGLIPGTRYRGTVEIKDDQGNFKYASIPSKWSDYFYTKNKVNQPDVTVLQVPSNMFTAKADFTATYEAGDDTGKYTPAHPDEVGARISTDDATWTEVTSTSSPKLANSQVTTGTRAATFSLEELRAKTTYYVQYRVKNAGGWSAWSASRQFVTLGPPAGLYIIDFPTLDFGILRKSTLNQTATLSNDSVKNHVVIDNTDVSVGWSLSAKLEPLKRTSDAQVMPWATLRMDINLQDTTDGGSSWNNYTTGVTGSPGTLTLNTGAAAQTLWSINTPADAQGTFRNEIDWNSVELDVPGINQEGTYQGKLVWSLDSIP